MSNKKMQILLCNDVVEFMNYIQKSKMNNDFKIQIINNLHFENNCKYMIVKLIDKLNINYDMYIDVFRCENNVLMTYAFDDENKLYHYESKIYKSYNECVENYNLNFDEHFINYNDIQYFL